MSDEPINTTDETMKNDDRETLSMMALHRLFFFNPALAVELWRRGGSATAVMEARGDVCDLLPDASQKIVRLMACADEMMHRAEVELDYNLRHGIRTLVMGSTDYPRRLMDCADAPLVLYVRGNAACLSARHTVAIVGTRRSTPYGGDLARRFVEQLHDACPDSLVVSGLAYGIDIAAHRAANACQQPTAAVLAHGLDQLYPYVHHADAERMVEQGGALISEYMTQTRPDKQNFVRRNRIVAGLADATVLVESAAHGGGLITARIAADYQRDVFAFPGQVGAPYSEGCNALIRDNGAQLITSADDALKTLGWTSDAILEQARRQGIERQLFPELTDDEQRVVDVLTETNDLTTNMLTVRTALSVPTLTAVLFSLEMKGMVKPLAGGTCHLLMR